MTLHNELTEALFIKPNIDIQNSPDQRSVYMAAANLTRDDLRDRWKTPQGKTILAEWKGCRYERIVLEQLVGSFYGHLDLRGISLSGENLSEADLHGIDFFFSNFQGANLSGTNLKDSYLSESDIRGTRFDWADMEGVLLDNVLFDLNTSFLGVNLALVNFTLAVLLKQQALDQARIDSLKKNSLVSPCSYKSLAIMVVHSVGYLFVASAS